MALFSSYDLRSQTVQLVFVRFCTKFALVTHDVLPLQYSVFCHSTTFCSKGSTAVQTSEFHFPRCEFLGAYAAKRAQKCCCCSATPARSPETRATPLDLHAPSGLIFRYLQTAVACSLLHQLKWGDCTLARLVVQRGKANQALSLLPARPADFSSGARKF
eukprot:431901-Rhodomonas_salina.1